LPDLAGESTLGHDSKTAQREGMAEMADVKRIYTRTISDIQRHGSAWVLPHPERAKPDVATLVRDDEVEQVAIDAVVAYERARGWEVESVEKDNRGFDLISRRPHPEDPKTAIEVRFIEVKGRSAVVT
jgi:hypothetical protein